MEKNSPSISTQHIITYKDYRAWSLHSRISKIYNGKNQNQQQNTN